MVLFLIVLLNMRRILGLRYVNLEHVGLAFSLEVQTKTINTMSAR
jgi:hypothetical protein